MALVGDRIMIDGRKGVFLIICINEFASTAVVMPLTEVRYDLEETPLSAVWALRDQSHPSFP